MKHWAKRKYLNLELLFFRLKSILNLSEKEIFLIKRKIETQKPWDPVIVSDTAGIRKKSKVKENVEFYSVMRSIKSIERSDVCILMIDATKGFNSQDQNIFWLAHRNGKGIITK